MKKIKVEFTDKTIFEGKDTTKVFIDTLNKVGMNKIIKMNISQNGLPLVSNKKFLTNSNGRTYRYTNSIDGNYVMCHTNTKTKYRILKKINRFTSDFKVVLTDDINFTAQPVVDELVNKKELNKILSDISNYNLSKQHTFINTEKETHENILRYIERNISKLRRFSDPTDKKYVYDNQIRAALESIAHFMMEKRWILLVAPMQSGKSGAYLSIAYILSKSEELIDTLKIDNGDIFNIWILTGMSETELHDQLRDDLSMVDSGLNQRVLGNRSMGKFLKPRDSWSKKMKDEFSKIKENSLIFIDESHFGASNRQTLNGFLSLIGIEQNGNPTPLKEKNIRVVSISATPYAEKLSDDERLFKKIVKLVPGTGYYGLSEMQRTGKLLPAKDLNKTEEIKDLLDVFTQRCNMFGNGYALIRVTDDKKSKVIKVIKNMSYNISEITYDSTTRKHYSKIDDIISKKPSVPTVVFIKGMLRAGKDMKNGKENIRLVHETKESQSDTTAQGLPGRVCGYSGNREILVYCDITQAKHWIDFEKSDFRQLNPGTKGKDIVTTGTDNIVIRKVNIIKISDKNCINDFNNLFGKNGVGKQRLDFIKKYLKPFMPHLADNVVAGKFFDIKSEGTLESYKNNDGNLSIANDDKKSLSNLDNYIISPVINSDRTEIEFGIGKIIQGKKVINSTEKSGYSTIDNITQEF